MSRENTSTFREMMMSYQDNYFYKGYELLVDLIDEIGMDNPELEGLLERKDADGLLAWSDSNPDEVVATPVKVFASGVLLDRSLEDLSNSTKRLTDCLRTSSDRLTTAARSLGITESRVVESPHRKEQAGASEMIPASPWIH